LAVCGGIAVADVVDWVEQNYNELAVETDAQAQLVARFDDWSARWLALGPDAVAMDRVNPVYIPRNHLVEEALAAATDGDLDPLGRLLDAVTSPYDERDGFERYAEGAPMDFGDYQTFCGT